MELKNGLKMNCCRESYPMEKRTIFKINHYDSYFYEYGRLRKNKRNKQNKRKLSPLHQPKKTKEAIKQKQLAYLKEHEQEIVDFVKSSKS